MSVSASDHASPSWSGYLNVECVSTIQKCFTKSVKWDVTSKRYQVADMFDVHDEKLFSAMRNWSNHCLHHLLPSERDTGHDLRQRRHSYQLVCDFVVTLNNASDYWANGLSSYRAIGLSY